MDNYYKLHTWVLAWVHDQLFGNKIVMWFSSWIVHSSDHIISSKLSSWFSTAHTNLFTLFASLIIWQCALPLNVQPRLVRTYTSINIYHMLHTSFYMYMHKPSTIKKKQKDMCLPQNSSQRNIDSIIVQQPMKLSRCGLIILHLLVHQLLDRWVLFLDILSNPRLLIVEPVFLYTFRNFLTPTFNTRMPSSSNSIFAIVYGFSPLLWW